MHTAQTNQPVRSFPSLPPADGRPTPFPALFPPFVPPLSDAFPLLQRTSDPRRSCLDWDVLGTRWQRVGLTLRQAYKALGVSARASTREIKAVYHKFALANHPDKVKFEPGSKEAEAAALAFMKVQRAYETVMEARKATSAGNGGGSGGVHGGVHGGGNGGGNGVGGGNAGGKPSGQRRGNSVTGTAGRR